eukprot:2068010-Rhodomonas_salina.1
MKSTKAAALAPAVRRPRVKVKDNPSDASSSHEIKKGAIALLTPQAFPTVAECQCTGCPEPSRAVCSDHAIPLSKFLHVGASSLMREPGQVQTRK